METATLQERRRLNDEIERTFISVAIYARNIQTYRQTQRGASLLGLYENFFADFALLILLTSDLPQLRNSVDSVKKAEAWIQTHNVINADDKNLLAKCNEGVNVFMAYKKVLSNQGVIALPTR